LIPMRQHSLCAVLACTILMTATAAGSLVEQLTSRRPDQVFSGASPTPTHTLVRAVIDNETRATAEELFRQHMEAEGRKIDLESQEIQRRMAESWYSPRILLQAIVGGVIAGGLLVAWAIAYLLPILRKERELAKLESARLEAENKLQRFQLDQQQAELD